MSGPEQGGAFLSSYLEELERQQLTGMAWRASILRTMDAFALRWPDAIEPLPVVPPDLFGPLPWVTALEHERVEVDGFEVPLFAESLEQRARRVWREEREARGLRRRRDPRHGRGFYAPVWPRVCLYPFCAESVGPFCRFASSGCTRELGDSF